MAAFPEWLYCPFHVKNIAVLCSRWVGCDKCGWNPDVSKARIEKLREKRREELESSIRVSDGTR